MQFRDFSNSHEIERQYFRIKWITITSAKSNVALFDAQKNKKDHVFEELSLGAEAVTKFNEEQQVVLDIVVAAALPGVTCGNFQKHDTISEEENSPSQFQRQQR